MPRRILRDGILRSKRVNSLTPLSELFYRRLMSVVDDFGRYEADPEILISACYPLNRRGICVADAVQMLRECVADASQLLRIYKVRGSYYLEMIDFNQQTRSKSKFPGPSEGEDATQMYRRCDADATQLVQEVVTPESFLRASEVVSSNAVTTEVSSTVLEAAANGNHSGGNVGPVSSRKKQTPAERASAIDRLVEFERSSRLKDGKPADAKAMEGFRVRLEQGGQL